MSHEGWLMSGTVGKTHDDSVWLKRHGTFDAFAWGGNCMALDEGTEPLGELTATVRRSVHGGVERDGVLIGAPEIASTTLTMKKLHYDAKKTDLKYCIWDVDQRTTCGGQGEDAWNEWIEILRYCYGKATERGTPPVTYDGESEEQVVKFPWQALYVDDIKRVAGEAGEPLSDMAPAIAAMFVDVTSCQPGRCPDICDDQEGCVVVAVTEDVGGVSYLAINLNGGDLDAWVDPPLPLTGFGAQDATAVACAGEFVIAVSTGAVSIIYSDALGANQVEVVLGNAPYSVDMINQAFVVVGAAAGFIYGSYDAGRTLDILDAGYTTAQILDNIMIARDNPQVIYAATSAAQVVIKTENGGRTWFACAGFTAMAGTGITALHVLNQNHILVGTDAGEIFESSDGGGLWTEQLVLPGLTAAATTTIEDITGCGCGDLGLVTYDSTETESFFFRNVDGGASGRWFQPENIEAVAAAYSLVALACCGTSHFIGVGGDAAVGDLVMLLE